jgi:hypothetical protein
MSNNDVTCKTVAQIERAGHGIRKQASNAFEKTDAWVNGDNKKAEKQLTYTRDDLF